MAAPTGRGFGPAVLSVAVGFLLAPLSVPKSTAVCERLGDAEMIRTAVWLPLATSCSSVKTLNDGISRL